MLAFQLKSFFDSKTYSYNHNFAEISKYQMYTGLESEWQKSYSKNGKKQRETSDIEKT